VATSPSRSTLPLTRLLQLLGFLYKPFRFCLPEMPPAYRAGGIQQEFGNSGDVAGILAGAGNQQVIAADDFGFAIGKQRKCEVGLAAKLARFVVRVCADGYGPDAGGFQGG
jgi:hypothetical protein